jgi:PelA/Pel-15E family pectate lyase
MKRRTFVISGLSTPALGADGSAANGQSVHAAMRRAVRFMDEQVSYRGGYVWAYLPDLSRRWGELEARRTMCWIQPPGTPTVGHCLLDAYHATGDEVFYRAAERTAHALMAAQHAAGGWDYVHDFAGIASLKHWYETIGANGWRLEEFQHHHGNATFDDAGTAVSSQFLLRMFLEKRDRRLRAPLAKAIDFVLRAQFAGGVADGGWPQRHPPSAKSVSRRASAGLEDGDYTGHVTFNDDVAGENIKFLLMCVVSLGETRLIEPVQRAMQCLKRLQQPAPQAGWGLQHLARDRTGRPAGAPASARSYEPRALSTHTTQTNVQQLFDCFRLTGDRSFLARVPDAIDWLASCKLTPAMIADNPLLAGRTHPTFVELGTNRPRFVHRSGSNVRNGAYYTDHDHHATLSHYAAGRHIDIARLQSTHDTLASMSDAAVNEMTAGSPLKNRAPRALPKYFSLREVELADLFAGAPTPSPAVTAAQAQAVIDALGDKGHWLSPLPQVTNRFRGHGPRTPYTGDAYRSKHVGDVFDTSPYDPLDPPQIEPYTPQPRSLGISSNDFVAQMGKLIAFLSPVA